uniref:Uncharacterized protein n=1 Tax=Brassica oleracea var. oleracea TaxID=109376 RepID=A0A0D3CM71_BRAOL
MMRWWLRFLRLHSLSPLLKRLRLRLFLSLHEITPFRFPFLNDSAKLYLSSTNPSVFLHLSTIGVSLSRWTGLRLSLDGSPRRLLSVKDGTPLKTQSEILWRDNRSSVQTQ